MEAFGGVNQARISYSELQERYQGHTNVFDFPSSRLWEYAEDVPREFNHLLVPKYRDPSSSTAIPRNKVPSNVTHKTKQILRSVQSIPAISARPSTNLVLREVEIVGHHTDALVEIVNDNIGVSVSILFLYFNC